MKINEQLVMCPNLHKKTDINFKIVFLLSTNTFKWVSVF